MSRKRDSSGFGGSVGNGRRSVLVLGIALGLACGLGPSMTPAAASTNMNKPAIGSQYDFQCTASGGETRSLQWDVLAEDGDIITIGERTRDQSFWRELPYYLIGSTVALRRTAAQGRREMTFELGGFFSSGDFGGLRTLTVGQKFAAPVPERANGLPVLDWKYSFQVEKAGRVDHAPVGEVEVYVILEQRERGPYKSASRIIYAPAIGAPIAFNYVDNLGLEERCDLGAYRKPGEAAPRMKLDDMDKGAPPEPLPQS
ncbi:hypothetical protein [Oceanibacterium hippocampi]|uniref:DUF3108 domain-containing protein n=1 Tax=Oceanibacterium hippocampi TaxID=745714 RepID=A0A1Y5S798_9PROT|nr:hypothetical protein [Oceanibacterium hippocampi]SLN34038.1 hypothetical protein OCH7691_01321 [Oceanibacterium hippocampi]